MFFVKNTTLCLAVISVLSFVALASIVMYGVKLSPDFTGGSLVEMSFTGDRPAKETVVAAFTALGAQAVTVRDSGTQSLNIRTATLSSDQQGKVAPLAKNTLNGTVTRLTTVGPVIGAELFSKGVWAVGVVSLAILCYIAFAFRPQGKVKTAKQTAHAAGLHDVSSWWYGVIAVITLAHDVVVPTGMFAWLGHMYGVEADTLFVTAILTILGFSVHDTIVIFDRIREKVRGFVGKQNAPHFAEVVGRAVTDTYGRSINTSLTVLISLATLYIFGPETTKMFALAMGLGVVAGTYSSIALAAPLLTLAHSWTKKG
jgi:preprotein translocase subunit SecF